jgi:hypothetical protein
MADVLRKETGTDYDAVEVLLGYDEDGVLHAIEDCEWEEPFAWAADPVRIELRVPASARPERRGKKTPIVIWLKEKELTCASAI